MLFLSSSASSFRSLLFSSEALELSECNGSCGGRPPAGQQARAHREPARLVQLVVSLSCYFYDHAARLQTFVQRASLHFCAPLTTTH